MIIMMVMVNYHNSNNDAGEGNKANYKKDDEDENINKGDLE